MKILSFQPFSLFANGGGNRILRRLYEGREHQITSLAIRGVSHPVKRGNINEITVDALLITRSWMRWRLRDLANNLRDGILKPFTVKKIRKAATLIPCDVVHIVNHGPFSAALCDDVFLKDKKIWVSFHDHFSTTACSFSDAKQLWKIAHRRLVISNELGAEYQKLFGEGQFELITDGVTADEITAPSTVAELPVTIYFAGLLHLAYKPLFEVLADALDELSKSGHQFKLILRGTQNIDFLNKRLFETEYRPVTLNSKELKTELDSCSILYLPIKFTSPDFYLYSLSTKMVGYLGGAGAILYHGPADSAACHLLEKSSAAVSCTTLAVDDLKSSIIKLLASKVSICGNAKILAQTQFDMNTIRTEFWLNQPGC